MAAAECPVTWYRGRLITQRAHGNALLKQLAAEGFEYHWDDDPEVEALRNYHRQIGHEDDFSVLIFAAYLRLTPRTPRGELWLLMNA